MPDLEFYPYVPPAAFDIPDLSLSISDERLRELVADLDKSGPCTVPNCAVCSGEIARARQ